MVRPTYRSGRRAHSWNLEERWPLTFEEKRTLAEFFAVQMVRGPAFFQYRTELVDQATQEQKRQFLAETRMPERMIEHQIGQMDFTSDTQRLMSMLRLSRLITIYLASMHWTLLRFREPVIALSDQPVVIWPLERGRADISVDHAWGPGAALEVRVPVSPYLAIVMDWLDQGDGPVRNGRMGQAKAINAFTIAQADRQWMHLPGHSPALRQGKFDPLSPRVSPGYTAQAAQTSRRLEATRLAERRREDPAGSRELEIVWMEPLPTSRP